MTLLSVNNLTKKIDKNQCIYIDQLKVKKNEIIGLVGNNGSGKTTILKIILGITPYEKGNFFINQR